MRYSITRRINGKDTKIELTWSELQEIFNRWTSTKRQETLYMELDWLEEHGHLTHDESEALQDEFDDILNDFEDRLDRQAIENDPEVAGWALDRYLTALRRDEELDGYKSRDYSWLTDSIPYTEAKEINV